MDLNKFLNTESLTKLNTNVNINDLKESAQEWIDRAKEDNSFVKKIGILGVATVVLFVGASALNGYAKTAIEEASQQKTEYQEIETFLTKYNKEAKGYQEAVGQIKGKILEEKEVTKAHVAIMKMAEQNGLRIINTKKTEKKNSLGNNIATQSAELQVEGNYSSILQFLNSVENADFFVSIDTIKMDKENDNNNAIDLNKLLKAKINYDVFCISSQTSGQKTKTEDTDKK